MQANTAHGVRRSNEDKRKVVLRMLTDKEWKGWADAVIARHCNVSATMVRQYRGWMEPGRSDQGVPHTRRSGHKLRYYKAGKVEERVIQEKESRLDRILAGNVCPHCGQKMPVGKS